MTPQVNIPRIAPPSMTSAALVAALSIGAEAAALTPAGAFAVLVPSISFFMSSLYGERRRLGMACAHMQRIVKEKEFRSQNAHLKRNLGERLGERSGESSGECRAILIF